MNVSEMSNMSPWEMLVCVLYDNARDIVTCNNKCIHIFSIVFEMRGGKAITFHLEGPQIYPQ